MRTEVEIKKEIDYLRESLDRHNKSKHRGSIPNLCARQELAGRITQLQWVIGDFNY